MNFGTFLKEFAPLVRVYGDEHFPPLILERIFYRIKDLDINQRKEVYNLLLDNCKFAPKVPDVIEYANLVRNRHRSFEPVLSDMPDNRGNPESVAKVKELIRIAFNKKGEPGL